MKNALPVDKIGFVHHMLFPEYARSEKLHTDTLLALARREDVGCVDLCLPLNETERRRAIYGLKGIQKQITYVNHLFPARKISLGTADPAERRMARQFLLEEVEAAAEIGATQFLFVSGTDIPGDHAGALERLADFTVWLCGVLRAHGITGILEPMDTGVDKRFLLGSTEESCRFVESLGLANLALEVDMGHIPCLFETFEASYVRAQRCLGRVHLSTCVLKNPHDPMFGDRHPSFFYPGGQLHKADLVCVLRVLRQIGYFDEGDARKLLFEVTPLPGENADACVAAHLALLSDAWNTCEE